jgi:hypothetical protein|nr:MAG TPA: hypothetical protein [Caudoviricetes sp.]
MDDIFERNPSIDVAYKTSDGVYFYTEDSARNYAASLEDKSVQKLVRLVKADQESLDEPTEVDQTTQELPVVTEDIASDEMSQQTIESEENINPVEDTPTADEKILEPIEPTTKVEQTNDGGKKQKSKNNQ